MRLLPVLLLLITTLPLQAGIEPWTLERLDVELHITLGPPSVTMTGQARVRALAESDGPTLGINSRAQVMQLHSVRGGGRDAVLRPFKDGSPIEVAELLLPERMAAGTTIDIEFAASSRVESKQFVLRPEAVYASWVEVWYPRPAMSGDRLAPPEAPGTTTLRMPKGWSAIAPGRLASRREAENEVVEVWETDLPAARSFVAAPFAVNDKVEAEGQTIGILLLAKRPAIREQALALARAVAAMERSFGPYPYPSFHIVEVPEGAGFAASSEQGFIMVRSSLLDAEKGNLPLFAHEAAHAWWGNLVRTDGPGGKMLSEAAAQYGAVLSIEAVEGTEAARRFLRYSREGYSPLQCAVGYFHIWRQGGDKPLSNLDKDRWDHDLADAKGHWFYHMVRQRLGNERFFTALRSLISEFGGREATVDDLRRAFSKVDGDPDLPRFLSQWLDRTGAPVLRVDWWAMKRGKAAEIHIEQVQSGEPFRTPLGIAIDLDDGNVLLTTVDLSDRKNSYTIDTPARPVGVRIDPEDRLLLWRPEYGPAPE